MQYLGQHFLKNQKAISEIIAALQLSAGDRVIEIGPGAGALTLPLIEMCKKIGCQLTAIEKDPTLAKLLEPHADQKTFTLTLGDALQLLPHLTELTKGSYKIVGNIPYYITGHLLRVISELKHKPELCVLMIQREVADRVNALPPKMNLLAAATQIWATGKTIIRLRPEDFDPPPKVRSAVIALSKKPEPEVDIDAYYALIRAVFKQPRKTLANNLLQADPKLTRQAVEEKLNKIGLKPGIRPQNLDLQTLINLTKEFSG